MVWIRLKKKYFYWKQAKWFWHRKPVLFHLISNDSMTRKMDQFFICFTYKWILWPLILNFGIPRLVLIERSAIYLAVQNSFNNWLIMKDSLSNRITSHSPQRKVDWIKIWPPLIQLFHLRGPKFRFNHLYQIFFVGKPLQSQGQRIQW